MHQSLSAVLEPLSDDARGHVAANFWRTNVGIGERLLRTTLHTELLEVSRTAPPTLRPSASSLASRARIVALPPLDPVGANRVRGGMLCKRGVEWAVRCVCVWPQLLHGLEEDVADIRADAEARGEAATSAHSTVTAALEAAVRLGETDRKR
eukprot:7378815-Prymnesium_polylepis.1